MTLDYTNNNTFCTFSPENPSDNPKNCPGSEIFTTVESLKIKFRKLNNKKSSGLDGIPNIAHNTFHLT